MRIWDIEPHLLCMKHLCGEHRELHGAWKIIREGKKGYSKHPETLRWYGKLDALKVRHDQVVAEIKHKKKNKKKKSTHKTDLPWVGDCKKQDEFVESVESQIKNIRSKNCKCKV